MIREMRPRYRKLPSKVRAEAYRLAREVADQRRKDGDPEGFEVIRDLAEAIRAIRLREPSAAEFLAAVFKED